MISILTVTLLIAAGLYLICSHILGKKQRFQLKNMQEIHVDSSNKKRMEIAGETLNLYQRFKRASIAALELSNSNLTYSQYLKVAIGFAGAGVAVGFLLNNILLSGILAAGFLFIPLLVLYIKQAGYTVHLNKQVQSALSMITNSYMQSDNIIRAVKENITRLEDPLASIFSEFLAANTFIDANITKNIRDMKSKVDNNFFAEWCDTLVLCQNDRELKYILPTIVQKMSDVQEMQEELNTMMYSIYKEYIMITAMVLLQIPFMRLLNVEWYYLLTHTVIGKIIVALIFLVALGGTAYVIKVNKPVSNL